MRSLTPRERLTEQYLYGMREVFREYCNLPASVVFLGRFQHGLDIIDVEGSHPFRPWGIRALPQWTWAKASEERARDSSVPKVTAIGSAWLYQLSIEGTEAFPSRLVQNGPDSALFIPIHGDEYREPFSYVPQPDFITTLDELRVTEVLLHGFDFLSRRDRDGWLSNGITPTCAGWPRLPPPPFHPDDDMGDRTRFLSNLSTIMRRHSRIVTNGMGSHVLYANSLGLDVLVLPPPPLPPSRSRLAPTHERIREEIELRHWNYLESFVLHDHDLSTSWEVRSTDFDLLRGASEALLGRSCIKSKDDLMSTLKWRVD